MNISSIVETVTLMFEFWIQTSWYIAFLMSLVTNLGVYIIAALSIDFLANKITKDDLLGKFIDDRPFKEGQKNNEIKNGIVACAMFALVSLLARNLFVGVIPESINKLLIEVLVFTIFYETYSYFVHRILHTKRLRKLHSIHHYSVRTNPWSAYSVHPIEALLIGLSAPLFMLVFPVHLSVIFAFHILGVMFTMIIHSNIQLNDRIVFSHLFNRYTKYHSAHHSVGSVNFGFLHSFWDDYFKTKFIEQKVANKHI